MSASEWILPDAGNQGVVKDNDNNKVLERSSMDKDVSLQDEVIDEVRQQWFRREFDNGCFLLINKGKYLTATTESSKKS